ncbi:MAG TPA: ATP-binding protein [Burkholderiales bacterium]|nr:ATP-binding protein [Burkholderiales bacterium]
MEELSNLLQRAEALLARVERLMPPDVPAPDFAGQRAFRWRRTQGRGHFQTVREPHRIRLDDLKGIDRQKELVRQNTLQFVRGLPANNVLLTGARGTGKSSLVKAVLNQYSDQGLRLIEVEKQELMDLPEIVAELVGRAQRFILFSDDLSFSAAEPGYTSLKAVLDGSVSAAPENVLIYATSNRRHLMPEYMQENLETKYMGDEIHPGESVEEKISLSERFGLWVSFYPFDQDEYLAIVRYWLSQHGVVDTSAEEVRREALQWALQRGSRSGRVAAQFARDWAGRLRVRTAPPDR